MSRSKKKTSITGWTTSDSEKKDKRICNRKVRRKNKLKLKKGEDDFIGKRDARNVWEMDKDGKMYFDEDEWPKLMRK